jgi:hypothetical protein
MKIKYCIPSYHRADSIGEKTLKYVPEALVFVSPDDYDDYVRYNPKYKDNIIKCPEGIQGTPDGKGKCKTMNYILDTEMTDDDTCVLFMDDDITCLMRKVHDGKDEIVSPDEFKELCEGFCLLAREWGCGMWSYNLNCDPLMYREFLPFCLHAYTTGAIQAFVRKDDLRFDTRFSMKEDIDMCLQQMQRYHKVLRVNRYYFRVRAFTGKGGVHEFRSIEREKEQFKMFQKKWGIDIVRPNKPTGMKASKIKEYNGAVKINVPLSGS